MPNAQCPMPNAQCPMPNAQCPMPYAQCLKIPREGNTEVNQKPVLITAMGSVFKGNAIVVLFCKRSSLLISSILLGLITLPSMGWAQKNP